MGRTWLRLGGFGGRVMGYVVERRAVTTDQPITQLDNDHDFLR